MGCIFSKNNKTFVRDNNTNNPYRDVYWTSREECCICLERKANILLLPCNHLILCDICSKNNINNNYNLCPICQEEIYSYNLLRITPAVPAY